MKKNEETYKGDYNIRKLIGKREMGILETTKSSSQLGWGTSSSNLIYKNDMYPLSCENYVFFLFFIACEMHMQF
jgi:threonyl-tRNA synthetase